MRADRIDFISVYCDGWCERCAFTDRCSMFAVHAAVGMCDGDIKAAVELAVGRPMPAGGTPEEDPEWRREIMNYQPTEAELDEIGREMEACERRVEAMPLTTVAEAVTTLALNWLGKHRKRLAREGSPAVREALEVIGWDVHLVHVKIHRALRGRDEAAHGRGITDDLIQNDWNGSAKVALLSIDRSTAAWAAIAEATRDPEARRLHDEMRNLRTEVERVFPDARKFQRPGFDQ